MQFLSFHVAICLFINSELVCSLIQHRDYHPNLIPFLDVSKAEVVVSRAQLSFKFETDTQPQQLYSDNCGNLPRKLHARPSRILAVTSSIEGSIPDAAPTEFIRKVRKLVVPG